MNKDSLFADYISSLEGKISFLEDKPEENLNSTLKALWLKAAGISLSVEKAIKADLPELTTVQQGKLDELINLRLNQVPLAHLTGRQSFMGVDLITDSRALIPRKETELLGGIALKIAKEACKPGIPVKVLDLCCGAGNLGISIAYHNEHCQVFSSDISQDAVDLTQENIRFLDLQSRVSVVQSDLFAAFESNNFYGKFDLIVCNPPYISTSKVAKMNPEISQNEPIFAFDGGSMGIKIIQALLRESPRFLKSNGWLAFEVGAGQGNFILQLLNRTESFEQDSTVLDHNKVIRAIAARKKESA